ncbi:MAG TPA: sugar ABC transporter permease [Thermomicrobiales bacterium]|jgi:multiple sugar transport system permease protein|nr:sugar ABC transporter permease [Thermomicrobiales bacterium]
MTTATTPTYRRPRGRSYASTTARWGFLMVAPLVIGFTVFFLIALAASFVLSFTQWTLPATPSWIGTRNYQEIWGDAAFRTALRNTFAIAVPLIIIRLILALLLAVALNSKIRFRGFYRLIFFLPVLTMPVAIGRIWQWLFDPGFGPINAGLGRLGLPQPEWLLYPGTATVAVVIVLLWSSVGYDMIIYLSGLQGIPKDLYDAASVDGANGWRRFRDVTVPLLSPTIFFLSVIGIIGALQVFDLVYVMTRVETTNRLPTAVYYIYDTGFADRQMGYATALAWVLLAIILVFTLIQFALQRRWVNYA